MRIKCPWCGERPRSEFTYLGDARVRRPIPPGSAEIDEETAARWRDFVYLRDNPAGPHSEYWYHGSGCRNWLIVTRDTRTHEITNVIFADPSRLEPDR